MKSGRDLALFLYSLNAVFPFVHHVSSRFYAFLQSLLVAVDNEGNSYNLLNGFDTKGNILKDGSIKGEDKITFDEGIYLFLRRNDIDVPNCIPTNVLDTLVKTGYVL
jgi:hypothetical protein